MLAASKREGKIEDHLLKKGEERKKRMVEAETLTKSQTMLNQVKKLTDKYLLQRFLKQFHQAVSVVLDT
jgi:hypothetical protein